MSPATAYRMDCRLSNENEIEIYVYHAAYKTKIDENVEHDTRGKKTNGIAIESKQINRIRCLCRSLSILPEWVAIFYAYLLFKYKHSNRFTFFFVFSAVCRPSLRVCSVCDSLKPQDLEPKSTQKTYHHHHYY